MLGATHNSWWIIIIFVSLIVMRDPFERRGLRPQRHDDKTEDQVARVRQPL